jgi:uncharacterized protein (DUF2249 family)
MIAAYRFAMHRGSNDIMTTHPRFVIQPTAIRLLAFILTITIVAASPALAGSGSRIVHIVSSKVVTVRVYDERGDEAGVGSGFLVGPGKVVTNAHVVAGGAWAEVIGSDQSILGTAPYALALDLDADLAVIPAHAYKGAGLDIIEDRPQVGDTIWVFGAPLGLDGTVSTGVVSAHRDIGGRSYIQMTAPISPGSSGGPVVDERGRVVGVVVSYLTGGQNLNLAIPAPKVVDLLQDTSGRHPFPDPDDVRRTGENPATDEDDGEVDAELVNFFTKLAFADSVATEGVHYGVIDEDDIVFDSPHDFLKFGGEAGQHLEITVDSDDFDPVIYLTDFSAADDGWWSVEDDDSGPGNAARVRVTLPNTDVYFLDVHGYNGGFGRYRVTFDGGRHRTNRVADDRWVLINESDVTSMYIDQRTIQSTYSHKTVWVMSKHDSLRMTDDGDRYDTELVRWKIDCDGMRISLLAATYQHNGNSVGSSEVSSLYQTWRSVVPGTIGEAILEYCCHGR